MRLVTSGVGGEACGRLAGAVGGVVSRTMIRLVSTVASRLLQLHPLFHYLATGSGDRDVLCSTDAVDQRAVSSLPQASPPAVEARCMQDQRPSHYERWRGVTLRAAAPAGRVGLPVHQHREPHGEMEGKKSKNKNRESSIIISQR